MSVYAKLMQARIKLQSTKLQKSGKNTFAKYNYFELGDFLPTVQMIFAELGLCGVVSFGQDEATLSVIDTDDKSEIVIRSPMSTAALKGCHEVQNLGAVQTYLRRYLWVTAMEIVEHDALDSAPPTDNKTAPKHSAVKSDPAVEESTPEEMEAIRDIAMEAMSYVKDGKPTSASAFVKAQNLDGDQKVMLWSLLDAPTRSALKTAEKAPQLEKA